MSKISLIYRKIAPTSLRLSIRNAQYWFLHKLELFSTRQFHPDFTHAWRHTVCFIIPSTKLSGGVAVVCEYANRLQDKGVKVLIASLDGSTDLSWFQGQKVKVVSWLDQQDSIRMDFDTVIATGWITAYAVATSGIGRAFYLVQSDERRFYPKESYLRKRVHDTYELPFRFITIASWMQNWLRDEFHHESALIRQGINTEIFNTSGSNILPRPENRIRILIEGAIDLPFKKIKETINFTDKLPKDKYEVWLVSSSGSPDPKWRIDRFFDRVPQKMMGDIYRSCHILLKLSTVEGMAGPPLEAMACGCVPIVYRSTGVDEYMKDGENGCVVDNIDNVNEILINKAFAIYTNTCSGSTSKLGRVADGFDWNASTQKIAIELSYQF